MIIGVDFDNTIVSYDKLVYKVALEKRLIPSRLNPVKNTIRDFLRKCGKEDGWTKLQGFIYGPCILEAEPFPGVLNFFKYCKEYRIKVYIISHKTRYPFLGPKYDLHKFANKWLEKYVFYDSKKIGISRKNVFLELTKDEKINRIVELKCTHFIDDLPEFLAEHNFPKNVVRILFDPDNKYSNSTNFICVKSWFEIMEKIK